MPPDPPSIACLRHVSPKFRPPPLINIFLRLCVTRVIASSTWSKSNAVYIRNYIYVHRTLGQAAYIYWFCYICHGCVLYHLTSTEGMILLWLLFLCMVSNHHKYILLPSFTCLSLCNHAVVQACITQNRACVYNSKNFLNSKKFLILTPCVRLLLRSPAERQGQTAVAADRNRSSRCWPISELSSSAVSNFTSFSFSFQNKNQNPWRVFLVLTRNSPPLLTTVFFTVSYSTPTTILTTVCFTVSYSTPTTILTTVCFTVSYSTPTTILTTVCFTVPYSTPTTILTTVCFTVSYSTPPTILTSLLYCTI